MFVKVWEVPESCQFCMATKQDRKKKLHCIFITAIKVISNLKIFKCVMLFELKSVCRSVLSWTSFACRILPPQYFLIPEHEIV